MLTKSGELYPNVILSLLSEENLLQLSYVSQSINSMGYSLVYNGIGRNVSNYCYLDDETNKLVMDLIEEKKQLVKDINEKITELVKSNKDNIIPLNESDLKRLRIKRHEKIDSYKNEDEKKRFKEELNSRATL